MSLQKGNIPHICQCDCGCAHTPRANNEKEEGSELLLCEVTLEVLENVVGIYEGKDTCEDEGERGGGDRWTCYTYILHTKTSHTLIDKHMNIHPQ